MKRYKEYYISFIYAIFVAIFFGTFESDLLNEAKSGDIVQYLYNIDYIRSIDFNQTILLNFPSVVWAVLLYTLTHIFSNDLFIINFLKFIIAFVICLVAYKNIKRKAFIVLILFSTLILEFYIGNVRAGFATIFFLYGFYQKNLKIKTIFYAISIFTHAISAWLILTDILSNLIFGINSKFKIGKYEIGYRSILLLFIPLLFFSFFQIFSSNSVILNLFGYSEGRYTLSQSSGRSILGFLIWFSMLIVIFLKNKLYKDEVFSILILAQVCLLYFSFDSIYRFLSSAIVIVLISAVNNRSIYNNIVLVIFSVFTIFHYSVFINFGKL